MHINKVRNAAFFFTFLLLIVSLLSIELLTIRYYQNRLKELSKQLQVISDSREACLPVPPAEIKVDAPSHAHSAATETLKQGLQNTSENDNNSNAANKLVAEEAKNEEAKEITTETVTTSELPKIFYKYDIPSSPMIEERPLNIVSMIRVSAAHNPNGGMESVSINRWRALAKRGHNIHIITTTTRSPNVKEPYITPEGIQFYFAKKGKPATYTPEWYNESMRIFEEVSKNITVDLLHLDSSATTPANVLQIKEKYRIPVSVTWHGLGFNKAFDHQVHLNDYASDDCVKKSGLPKDRVQTIFNAIDPATIYLDKKDGPLIKKLVMPKESLENQTKPRPYVIGFQGRLIEGKGVYQLAIAAKNIITRAKEQSTEPPHFIVFGRGNETI
ncbi:hypothetical protein HDV05_001717, partial [Chytridiales sp. JEL 0842]